jgi:hypothetical protein
MHEKRARLRAPRLDAPEHSYVQHDFRRKIAAMLDEPTGSVKRGQKTCKRNRARRVAWE